MSLDLDLDLADTPEGRAIRQVALSIASGPKGGAQRAAARKLARIAQIALTTLEGGDGASLFFIGLSRDCLRQRGQGKGAKRS